MVCVWLALLLGANPSARAAAAVLTAPLRVVVVDGAGIAPTGPLAEALTRILGAPARVVRPNHPAGGDSLSALREAAAAVFIQGPGANAAAADVGVVREFIGSGAGVVVLAATSAAWPQGLPVTELIGAVPGGPFAAGAPMAVIDLYPHPILTGVTRLETKQSVTRYDKLADDAQMIIEGTVGETTTPLAWVRQRGQRRLAHFALADAALFADPFYQQMIANALRWSARRPVPGARTVVQRTFMPDAYPGAFAITLPNGPSLCLDPVRGGVSYVWAGDFIDLRPRWLTKEGKPARFFGDVFYREKEWQPLRAGGPSGKAEFQFRGYTLRDGEPEFHYEIGGRDVYESFAAAPGGGLLRRFRVGAGGTPLSIQLEPQAGAEVATRGLERDGPLAYFANAAGGEFTIEIRRKALVTP